MRDGRSLHGFSNGLSVAEVVLVALAERRHELDRHELHIMAKGQQLTAEVMGSETSLHGNQASWHVS